jgi:hypothetical protein
MGFMKYHAIGARTLAALLPLVCAAGFALPAVADLPSALTNAALLTEKSSYHIEMTETAGGQTVKASGDMQSYTPLKMHVTTDMGSMGSMQMIVLAPDTYMKQGSAPWKKFPADPSAWAQMSSAGDFAKNKADYSATDLGMQTKDGQMLHAYRVTNTVKNSTQTIFLDSSGRMARLEAPNLVMKFSNFGESVSITPPM